jgi:hypothetical protein
MKTLNIFLILDEWAEDWKLQRAFLVDKEKLNKLKKKIRAVEK